MSEETDGLLILDVTGEQLDLLRAVWNGSYLLGRVSSEAVADSVARGLVDRTDHSGLSMATPGRHTLWAHDRLPGLLDEHGDMP